ncbi:DUF4405 domain-containing protein [Adlercreutzia muris]|uniref:DUF4405 domain-containing protein n=1 Tax=Adlercreutzia muris TaxID=1796610 RepID=UPI0021D5A223|nr:DUF4405 domain-containing protein [Adlercreutzia muris]MCU7584140.1 DUF4405 domain-containing protein [Adlercreutzia muris]
MTGKIALSAMRAEAEDAASGARAVEVASAVSLGRRSARRRLVLDGVVLAVYSVAANPAITGVSAHEWLALGSMAALAAHCAARGLWRGTSFRGLALTVLNGLALLTLALCAVSGIMVSGEVLPAFGLYADGYYFWDPLHAVAAKMLLALLLAHMVVHAPWIMRALKR